MAKVLKSIKAVFTGAGIIPAAALLAASLFVPAAQGCEDQIVRDAAFGFPRDVHILAVMAPAGDPRGGEIYDRLEQWSSESGRDLNVALCRIDPEDPGVRWQDYGIPSAPPSTPVVVMTGSGSPGRPNFLIDHWEPGPDEADLRVLESSPARERIRSELARRLAVLVHVPGNESTPGAVGELVASVAESWSGKEPSGVAVVRLERSDERERLLLSFMGARRTGPDLVGVVFGRGKMMPPLRGEGITRERLNELLGVLVGDCSCLQSPGSLGADLPLIWNESHDQAVVALRGSLTGAAAGAGRILAATIWTLGGLIFLVGLATVWVVRSKKDRNAV